MHCVGNGANTLFCLDPWLKTGFILLEQYGYRPIYDLCLGPYVKVCNFIRNGGWVMVASSCKIKSSFRHLGNDPEFAAPILETEDEIVWIADESGVFSIASCVKALSPQES